MLKGQRPKIFGDGEQSRDFTYVANVVEANLRAATAEKGAGEAFNVACGSSVTLNQLVEYLNDIIGCDIQAEHAEERVGDVKHSLADISAATGAFGYVPQVDFRTGLSETVAWYRDLAGS